MCYLSAATAIGLSWQCQFAELRSVQQTTTEPLPYVSLRRHKESRPPLPQLPLQSTQQQLLLKDGRRSVGVDSCDDDGSSIIPIMFSSPFFTKSQTQECRGGCTRCFVVKHFKASGYAAVCKSHWQSTSSVPGGEYEYIDVVCDKEESGDKSVECYIMDIDFQAQFEMARPAQQYNFALKALPMVFMGKST